MALARIELRALGFRWSGAGGDLLHIPQLTLAAGERCFVHGESGCGKSTLLGLLAGVLRPTCGEHHFLGQRFDSLAESQRDAARADHIGYLFQQFNLLPYLSAVDNVMLPCRLSTVRRNRVLAKDRTPRAEAERMLAALGVPAARWQQRSAQLSVGEQQRVAAARALIGSPELVLADEPTSALDATRQQEFLALLADEAAQSGATLVFVSHDMRLAAGFDTELSLQDFAPEVRA